MRLPRSPRQPRRPQRQELSQESNGLLTSRLPSTSITQTISSRLPHEATSWIVNAIVDVGVKKAHCRMGRFDPGHSGYGDWYRMATDRKDASCRTTRSWIGLIVLG